MKPAPFEYFAPTDLAEALDLLARYGDEAKILAGGQSLMPLMNMRLARPPVSDALRALIAPLLPKHPQNPKGGRPRGAGKVEAGRAEG